jgi:hypothetical protein
MIMPDVLSIGYRDMDGAPLSRSRVNNAANQRMQSSRRFDCC